MPARTQVAETLLGSPGEMERLNRGVVRAGLAAALAALVALAITALVTGDTDFYIQAGGAALAASLMGAQVATGRESAWWVLLTIAAVVVVGFRLVGPESMLVPASVGLVVVVSLATLFVGSHRLIFTSLLAGSSALVPLIWDLSRGEAVVLGLVMAISVVFASSIFYMVRNAASALNRRFQVLFESSPMAAMEADLTYSVAYLATEFSGRKDRIRGFLGAYPDVVRRAASLIRVVRANQAARELVGVGPTSEIVVDGDTIPAGWVEWIRELLIATVEGREFVEGEVVVEAGRGRRTWMHLRAVNASAGDNPDVVLVALADVSHLKAKEDAMNELIAAKDEFVASISHELRTPLTAVVGLTSEMANGGLGGPERDEIIELVASQAKEMSHIIDDLLVATRAGLGTVTVALDAVDLNQETRAAIDGVGIHVESEVPVLPPAIGDGPRIRQILRNLLTNVERYGGSERRLTGGHHGGRVWIDVRDNGSGVSAEDAALIFEPYTSAHRGVAGSVGLGLSVARQLAERMGGSLTYLRDGEESVFRLELAVATDSLLV